MGGRNVTNTHIFAHIRTLRTASRLRRLRIGEELMGKKRAGFVRVRKSLADIVGRGYMEAVNNAHNALVTNNASCKSASDGKVDFYPAQMQVHLESMLQSTGKQVLKARFRHVKGMTTKAFNKATATHSAPLSTYGYYRIGEDGIQRLATKSEHYHVPLGHGFPGYRIVDNARRLGIPNATHNNTRGHITRLLEEELVRSANSGRKGPRLDTVLNLQTGSLAVEAAVKMMLARFYRAQAGGDKPASAGKTPVFLVIGDDDGNLPANYHGTTVITQALRGMWPEMLAGLDKAGLMRVTAIRPNRLEDMETAFRKYHTGSNRIAGFLHEIVMMNYGGRLLTRQFLRKAYALCRRHDIPVLVDEIQSCLWNPRLYMFREYGLKPSFAAIGKGFPGGEYAASRLLFDSAYDSLPQFGALVTNGQEELASLAYLVTMTWAQENAHVTGAIGDYFETGLRKRASVHPDKVVGIEGNRHLAAICFEKTDTAMAFATELNKAGLDASCQTYKSSCPPAALLKLPLIMSHKVVDFVLEKITQAFSSI